MRKIVSIAVSTVIFSKAEEVFETLSDYESFPRWWHVPVKALPGGVVIFRPLFFVAIKVRVEERPPINEIYFHYIGGPIVGQGVWKISRTIDPRSTEISYSVSIYAKNYFFQKLLETSFFRKKHERDILKLIRSLGIIAGNF